MALKNGLYRNPNGRFWLYDFRWRKKHYKGSTGHTSLPLAKEWLNAFRSRLAHGDVGIVPASQAPTLKDALADWCEAKGHKSASHMRNVKNGITTHFAAHLQDPIDTLDTHKVELVLQAYLRKEARGRANSIGGRNSLLRSLNCIVGYAIRRKQIPERPYDVAIETPQAKPMIILEQDEVASFFQRLAELAPPDAVNLSLIEYGMGFRESEARHVHVECISIRQAKSPKGDVFWIGHCTPWDPIQGTKGKEADAVAIPEWLCPHLVALIGDRKEGYLIPGRKGGAKMRCYTLPYVKAAAVAIGRPGLTPHRLRASCATHLSEAGVPLQAIQDQLRHKHMKTTRIYVRKGSAAVRQAFKTLGEDLGLSSPHGIPLASLASSEVQDVG